jgi:DNA-binding NtrC family response regulator
VSSRPRHTIPHPDRPAPVLLVSPYDEDHEVLPGILNHPHWEWQSSGGCSEAVKVFARRSPAVLFCERDQSDGCWQDLLELGSAIAAPPLVIVCSRQADDRLWAEVLNRGGFDVLAKPFVAEEVLRVALGAWHASKRHSAHRRHPRGNVRPARLGGSA